MKREGKSAMLITTPDSKSVKKEIRLVYEERSGQGLFEVEILGESPLKGYKFAVLQGELRRVRDQGAVIEP